MSIIDEGTTYYSDVAMMNIGGEGGRPSLSGNSLDTKTDSNDDSADKRSREEEQ